VKTGSFSLIFCAFLRVAWSPFVLAFVSFKVLLVENAQCRPWIGRYLCLKDYISKMSVDLNQSEERAKERERERRKRETRVEIICSFVLLAWH